MKMPVINECDVADCAYNTDRMCRALAITVGEVRHPNCDTFLTADISGGDPAGIGRVGACKVADCRHNMQLECQAPGINIGYRQDRADCLTYAPT